uniref:WAP domain-containing protein n=1 Tax=Timema douglasi TaxID=61478 RepID=A0A7R8V9I6_TIMDO|nr:unnamed protein product [Timema douglasi]
MSSPLKMSTLLMIVTSLFMLVSTTEPELGPRTIGPLRHDTECSRPGLCPHIRSHPVDIPHRLSGHNQHFPPPSLCGNICINDHACPVGKKCCPTTCGYACYDAVHIVE